MYNPEYYKKHKEQAIRSQTRWRKLNPEKTKGYNKKSYERIRVIRNKEKEEWESLSDEEQLSILMEITKKVMRK